MKGHDLSKLKFLGAMHRLTKGILESKPLVNTDKQYLRLPCPISATFL